MSKKEDILKFIKKLLFISIPIILQSIFTNLASLLDTMMVGNVNDTCLSGVYIANQVIFVINLGIFGSVEGASVFFSQFLGNKDTKHLRNTFAFKLIASITFALIAMIIVYVFGRNLVSLLSKDQLALDAAIKYMNLVALSFIPFAITVSCTSSLRESHNTISPMIITLVGIFINVLLNYIFIFGNFGAPKLEEIGAAIGTICDRFFETIAIIIVLIIKKKDFTKDFFKSFHIERELFKNLIIKSLPLLFNELLWSLGQTGIVYVFTQKSAIATTVLPIVSTIFNLVLVVTLGLGNGVTIVVGNIIGANKMKDAQEKAYVSLIFCFFVSLIFSGILFLISPVIVNLYSEIDIEARALALNLLRFDCIYLIITTANTIIFFLMRAGGRTFIVFLFDSAFSWIISIPGAFLFLHLFPHFSFQQLFINAYLLDLIKTVIGMILIISKSWHKNIIQQYDKNEN